MCCRLRDLLSFEDSLYGQEMVAKEETILERQAKMRERAKKLKEDREAERLGVVHKKYEEQWRFVPRLPRLTLSSQQLTSPHVYFFTLYPDCFFSILSHSDHPDCSLTIWDCADNAMTTTDHCLHSHSILAIP